MQDYKLTSFKEGDYKDNYGNAWCDATFEGISEPCKWVVKDPSRITVGATYYGIIADKTSKSGKTYRRFTKKPKEEVTQKSEVNWDLKDARIQYQWAVGRSLEHFASKGEDYVLGQVKDLAIGLSAMVDELATNKTGVSNE